MRVWSSVRCSLSIGAVLAATGMALPSEPPETDPREVIVGRIVKAGLRTGKAHTLLTELCTKIGHRLSGSEGAAKAVDWARRTMESAGLERVRLEPVMVPHWVRGRQELAYFSSLSGGKPVPLRICALGGSVATASGGITARVLEVRSFDELHAAGKKARGRIIFFNRAFDQGLFEPFLAYGGAVDQRGSGAIEAAKAGGIAALVRSMTSRIDDSPHTGGTRYSEGVPHVPAAAVSTLGANRLSEALAKDPELQAHLEMACQTLPDLPSHNVLSELTGRERPHEVVLIGGHLDSWDVGQGAHDDGAGCVHAIEALRLLKELGLRPRRTIRIVLFMNEENGLRGGQAYAATDRPGETHIAAIESDTGGFLPRGFGATASPAVFKAIAGWAPLFTPIDADRIVKGGGGADIAPLMAKGVPGLGLTTNDQRYFDVHHSVHDTIDTVHDRELELGAIALAIMSYLIAEEGLPAPASTR